MPTHAEHPARTDAVGQRTGDHEAEAVHEVVDAHDHGEDATAERIGSATLHEQRVAHDSSTVTDPCEDEARERDPDVRRHGGCPNADRLHEDAHGIDRPTECRSTQLPALKLPTARPSPMQPKMSP
jgi:hypothetical protein